MSFHLCEEYDFNRHHQHGNYYNSGSNIRFSCLVADEVNHDCGGYVPKSANEEVSVKLGSQQTDIEEVVKESEHDLLIVELISHLHRPAIVTDREDEEARAGDCSPREFNVLPVLH